MNKKDEVYNCMSKVLVCTKDFMSVNPPKTCDIV